MKHKEVEIIIMAGAIRILFESSSAVDSNVFKLVVSCTSQLASAGCDTSVKIALDTYDHDYIIDKLNEFISISHDGSYYFEWADSFISYYSSY